MHLRVSGLLALIAAFLSAALLVAIHADFPYAAPFALLPLLWALEKAPAKAPVKKSAPRSKATAR